MSRVSSGMSSSVSSPCIGICEVVDNHCMGCLRSLDEIAGWARLSPLARQAFMQTQLRGRQAVQRPFLQGLQERQSLIDALLPLEAVPQGRGWNHAQLVDLLPPGPPHEAAVLVGLIPRPSGTQVLLTRRTETLRTHAGQVGFPGGRIDDGDRHPVGAALREAWEEIGLDVRQVAPLGYLDPFITISNYRVLPVVAAVSPDFSARPNPEEVDEVFEVPLAYLMDMGNVRCQTVMHGGRERPLLEYTWPDQRIWGATAAMLTNLQQRLSAL